MYDASVFRRPAFVAVALATLTAALVWWYAARPVDIGIDWHEGTWNSASFAPFRAGQSPLTRNWPTPEQVENDLAHVKTAFRGVRTYAAIGAAQDVPALAARHGLKVIHGAWLSSTPADNEAEVSALIEAANRYPQSVERVIVGNEVLLRRDLDAGQIIQHLDRVRQSIRQPVSYADVWAFWLKNPQIADHVDYLTIHILPYWEDEPASVTDMEQRFVEVIGKIKAAFPGKPILIGEAGWPTEGRSRGPAIADLPNAAHFLRRLPQLAAQYGFDYNVVEAYDQLWKAQQEGTVGARWGLYDVDRQQKFGTTGPVDPFPEAGLRAGASLLGGLALALWLIPAGFGLTRALAVAGLAQLLAAGAIDTLWHAQRLAISPASVSWCLQRLLFFAADTGLLDKPTVSELYRGYMDTTPALAEAWAWVRILATVVATGVLAALLRARLFGREAPGLARAARLGYLGYVAGALMISAMLAFNGRYLDIPIPEFWLPALGLPALWLAARLAGSPRGYGLAALTAPGPARLKLGLWLLAGAVAVILGEGFAIVGEDFTAMHPDWSERAPLIWHAFFWNRQILACALMLVWLALPLLAEWRRPVAAAT